MKFSYLKYFLVLTVPFGAYLSFLRDGLGSYTLLIYAFGVIPFLELFFKPDESNLTSNEEDVMLKSRFFDILLYIMVPIQYFMLFYFLHIAWPLEGSIIEKIGRITAMGVLCGVIGINVAHELGHRNNKWEQWMAKLLLLTSLYTHFYIEHNRGHHKNVSTHEDPSSARKNETLYTFWLRTISQTYMSAWKLENERLKKAGKSIISFHNEMIIFQILQIGLCLFIFFMYGFSTFLAFIGAAIIGFLLLETVNYIEHYGLSRTIDENGRAERVMPWHSWNSNHILGRMLLFELSRHSDHHFIASRKYQILRSMEKSPQMPTGYPGMMLMATLPPLWFWVMNKKLSEVKALQTKQ